MWCTLNISDMKAQMTDVYINGQTIDNQKRKIICTTSA